MNNYIIEKYISKLTKQDIISYTKKQNINLSEKEINTIYKYIKEKYKDFLNGPQEQILIEIKKEVTPTTYKKIEELYYLYKKKYRE